MDRKVNTALWREMLPILHPNNLEDERLIGPLVTRLAQTIDNAVKEGSISSGADDTSKLSDECSRMLTRAIINWDYRNLRRAAEQCFGGAGADWRDAGNGETEQGAFIRLVNHMLEETKAAFDLKM